MNNHPVQTGLAIFLPQRKRSRLLFLHDEPLISVPVFLFFVLPAQLLLQKAAILEAIWK